MASPCVSTPFALALSIQFLGRFCQSSPRYPPPSPRITPSYPSTTTALISARSSTSHDRNLIPNRVTTSSRRPHTTSRRLLPSRSSICSPQPKEVQRLYMDHRLVCRCQHMCCMLYPHPLLHQVTIKFIQAVLHRTPPYCSPPHYPHVCERRCLLCACAPPPGLRQASNGRYLSIHSCDPALICGVGICRELHVGQ